jgi:hypothetical protein
MPFEPSDDRINRNGRPKGAKNRTTEQLRAVIQSVIENNIETLEQDLQMIEPKDRLGLINQLLRHVLPAPVADISQFSETDLDVLLNRLKKHYYEKQAPKN